ncbi:MAG: HRDC domain-containing protein [Bacteroidia bacterium]|nr:HRDC domain-containing protein [Bacteroidia bacterium]
MKIQQEPQLQLALEFVQYTDRNVFLTGKAGTGKTTFLHTLRNATPKRMVVVAPTGVAAINAGGVTIHSFFQLPFGPCIPGNAHRQPDETASDNRQRRMSREKIRIIKSLDLLVIDEISMVRADMLDGIDEVLRKYKDRSKPFGGVQLLMIGDLHQLSPVVKEDEWNILKEYYDTVYFFSSRALKKTQPVSIELKHIFRQSDASFIDLLNQVRHNTVDPVTLQKLNERYIPGFKPNDEDGYIILTTHNAIAHDLNQSKLGKIKKKPHIFTAIIKGEFPEYAYPTEAKLELKAGAQVMFVKNDSSYEKLFYNGKIGKITRIEDDVIYVKCPADHAEIPVNREEWENVKYSLNNETKIINETVAGSFTQFPLKLAWAITIHKSQGLTFDKAIIDANASFAHGQVYVALSRCKSFEGLVLRTPITHRSIKTDSTISEFTDDVNRNEPDEQKLEESKILFQQSLVYELFDFKKMKYRFSYLKKIIIENDNIIEVSVINDLNHIEGVTETEIYSIAEKFKLQLEKLLLQNNLPEKNTGLQERIKKAAVYFTEKIDIGIYNFTKSFLVETDNKIVEKSINDALEALQIEAFIKLSCLKTCLNGFVPIAFLHARANAEIDFYANIKTAAPKKPEAPKNINHPLLYMELKRWRDDLAEQNGLPVYTVLPQKALKELVARLPVTLSELETIKGIGKIKVRQFGEEIITIISSYCRVNNIQKSQREIAIIPKKEKLSKPDTKRITLFHFPISGL